MSLYKNLYREKKYSLIVAPLKIVICSCSEKQGVLVNLFKCNVLFFYFFGGGGGEGCLYNVLKIVTCTLLTCVCPESMYTGFYCSHQWPHF